MKIRNEEIFGFESAMRVMRYPMGEGKKIKTDEQLSKILASCKPASGHDSMLKGILVKADFIADHSWWLQEGRYHFIDIASSESKMHTIVKGSIREKCNVLVGAETLNFVRSLIEIYNGDTSDISYISARGNIIDIVDKKQLFEAIIMNTPLGYELKAGIVTNYLQLKQMYQQRKNHKMSSWNTDFRSWVESLPNSELITGKIVSDYLGN